MKECPDCNNDGGPCEKCDGTGMTIDALEQKWIDGRRSVYSRLLRQCILELGADSSEAAAARWIVEREEIVAKLRDVCEHHGDNDWPDMLNLSDVIENHLFRHLET